MCNYYPEDDYRSNTDYDRDVDYRYQSNTDYDRDVDYRNLSCHPGYQGDAYDPEDDSADNVDVQTYIS